MRIGCRFDIPAWVSGPTLRCHTVFLALSPIVNGFLSSLNPEYKRCIRSYQYWCLRDSSTRENLRDLLALTPQKLVLNARACWRVRVPASVQLWVGIRHYCGTWVTDANLEYSMLARYSAHVPNSISNRLHHHSGSDSHYLRVFIIFPQACMPQCGLQLGGSPAVMPSTNFTTSFVFYMCN